MAAARFSGKLWGVIKARGDVIQESWRLLEQTATKHALQAMRLRDGVGRVVRSATHVPVSDVVGVW